MPTLPTGLSRISGRYYLRRRIPVDLRDHFPDNDFHVESLRTADYRVALRQFNARNAALLNEWETLRDKEAERRVQQHIHARIVIDKLTPEIIDQICKRREIMGLESDEMRRTAGDYVDEDIDGNRADYEHALAPLKAAVGIGNLEVLAPLLQQFLDLFNYEVNIPAIDYRRLAIAFGRATIRTTEQILKRMDGELIKTPTPDTTLSQVIDDYLEDYPKDRVQMLKKIRFVLPVLLEVVGNKPVATLRQADINNFFALVQQLPSHWYRIQKRERMTVQEIVQAYPSDMSPATLDGTYVASISPFLEWCKTNKDEDGFPANLTAKNVRYRGQRKEGEKRQRAFTLEELQRLFGGSEMKAFGKETGQAHKFWLPHLALFTGARINELCQLNPQSDIRQDPTSKAWYLDITDEGPANKSIKKSVKTEGSRRKVPIHTQLIELGFLNYVESVKARGDTLLFARFAPKSGRASPTAMAWFGDFLKEIDLRDETPKARLVGSHAFRHTFLQRARTLGIQDAEAITGHDRNRHKLILVEDGKLLGEKTRVVQNYEGDMPLVEKVTILERLSWPNELVFRHSVWRKM